MGGKVGSKKIDETPHFIINSERRKIETREEIPLKEYDQNVRK